MNGATEQRLLSKIMIFNLPEFLSRKYDNFTRKPIKHSEVVYHTNNHHGTHYVQTLEWQRRLDMCSFVFWIVLIVIIALCNDHLRSAPSSLVTDPWSYQGFMNSMDIAPIVPGHSMLVMKSTWNIENHFIWLQVELLESIIWACKVRKHRFQHLQDIIRTEPTEKFVINK